MEELEIEIKSRRNKQVKIRDVTSAAHLSVLN